MSKVHLTAKIVAKEGQADNVEKALLAVVPTVRAENGCLRYDLHRDSRGGEDFLFYEIWESPEALKAHGQSAHMNAMREQIKDLVAGPTQISFWRAVDRMDG
ncbi:MAG: putative quinol monooxygenase [Pseudomonadota bacterium]|nr:antibiotic biosynthesis monooxygenase [Pseudomonadota bacterium]MBV1716057.1 antibiotic biosynthesis monooxygenase [Desulfarculus sp.]MCG2766657.1 antibiotic biosynthesis monooxygenase [Desulfarculaceae bacterium]MBU4381670.1 antibiotic biosynthesis monooxygenase [Pseudomonadota bacterium]MBU4567090.1 antibiotic biosynthesis monooxygenase [Pseudomonadota bacterium]